MFNTVKTPAKGACKFDYCVLHQRYGKTMDVIK